MHVLLTGPPGIGKTTLVKSVTGILQQEHVGVVSMCGFYTEEVRHQRQRIGFDVVPVVDGSSSRSILARVVEDDTRNYPRVGKYAVDVKSLERACQETLGGSATVQSGAKLAVIDEIGKMEMLSRMFQEVVRKTFDKPQWVVLATVPLPGKALPLVEQLVNRPDTKLYTVSVTNRDRLLDELVTEIKNSLASHSATGGSGVPGSGSM